MTYPVLLIDSPDDGYAEECGWVSTTVPEAEARDLLAEFCIDEHGDGGARPVGPARRVWLRCKDPDADIEDQRWAECAETDDGAVEFYEFDATDTAPSEAAA